MSATPRTDAEAEIRCLPHDHGNQVQAVPADLARTLERELAELEGLRRLRKLLEEAVDTVDGDDGQPRGNDASQILANWQFREFAEHGRYV